MFNQAEELGKWLRGLESEEVAQGVREFSVQAGYEFNPQHSYKKAGCGYI